MEPFQSESISPDIAAQRARMGSLIGQAENQTNAMQQTQAQREALAAAIEAATRANMPSNLPRFAQPSTASMLGPLGAGAAVAALGAGSNSVPPAQNAGMPSSASMDRADAAEASGSSPPNTPASNLNVDNANPAYAPDFDKFSQMFQPASRIPIDEVQSQYAIQNQNTDAPDSLDYLRDKQMPSARQAPAASSAPASAPMPPTRPAELAREQPSILSRIFSGENFQSNNQPVNKPMGGAPVNWGNSDSAADFFRADKALQQARPEMFKKPADEGMARGGSAGNSGANGKDAALHKALEIIHHMLTQRH